MAITASTAITAVSAEATVQMSPLPACCSLRGCLLSSLSIPWRCRSLPLPAGFVVHNDAGLPFNPCFICRHCKPKVDDICRGSASQGQVGAMKRTEAIYTYDI